jgi:glucose-1-phosphate adenylyltransferase
MKTRVVILAGGEGSRLSVLTAKRAKPAVPFAGKYRIIDFALSNCTNSGLFDVMMMAQYRPQSLIEHIGAGGPWDLNRDFTGGIRIYTPYKARFGTDWFVGNADAVQQNFSFIKRDRPDHILILSGDHIYAMDYDALITFHIDHQADVTMATVQVPTEDGSRYGIVGVDEDYKVSSFVEKPKNPTSTLANMGVYVFNLNVLDRALWSDRHQHDSVHDFGRNILPRLVAEGRRVFAYPYSGYWVDVGTIESYWQAQMDLLVPDPPMNLNDRRWVIHTRTEERPPVWIERESRVTNSMLSDGCVIERGAIVENSILSPGVVVRSGAVVRESILMTDCRINAGAKVERAILDKRVQVGENSMIGGVAPGDGQTELIDPGLVLIGKNSKLPPEIVVHPGALIGTDVVFSDFDTPVVESGSFIQTKLQPFEISD